MQRKIVSLLFAVYFISSAVQAQTGEEIMDRIRKTSSAQKQDLTGQLENGPQKTPFHLEMDGSSVRYEFKESGKIYRLKMGDKQSTLDEIDSKGNARAISAEQQKQPLFNTDITLEDLSFGFFYWPDPELLRTEKTQGRPAWVIRLRSSNKKSQYAYVDVWADKQASGFLKITAYGPDGKVLKDFTVVQLQEIQDSLFLKRLRVQVPGKPPVYLRINRPEE